MTQSNKRHTKNQNPESKFLWVNRNNLSSVEFDVKSEKESEENDQNSDPRKRWGC